MDKKTSASGSPNKTTPTSPFNPKETNDLIRKVREEYNLTAFDSPSSSKATSPFNSLNNTPT